MSHSLPLMISLVNVLKFAESCEFPHTYFIFLYVQSKLVKKISQK